MSLKYSLTSTDPYDYLSEQTEANPASFTVTLDNSGGTVETTATELFLIATTYVYTNIQLEVTGAPAGITWYLSSDGSNYSTTLSLGDIDATSNDVVTSIWCKAEVANDGTIGTGDYISANYKISYTEEMQYVVDGNDDSSTIDGGTADSSSGDTIDGGTA